MDSDDEWLRDLTQSRTAADAAQSGDESPTAWLSELIRSNRMRPASPTLGNARRSGINERSDTTALAQPASSTVPAEPCASRPEQSACPHHRGRLASGNYWKVCVPKTFLAMPALHEVMKEVCTEQAVEMHILPHVLLASKLLEHANNVIRSLPVDCYFKVGLTMHPSRRWRHPQYGYSLDVMWTCMKVVAVLVHGESAGILEAALIATWKSDPRCLNKAAGGEAVAHKDGPFFVYVVVTRALCTGK